MRTNLAAGFPSRFCTLVARAQLAWSAAAGIRAHNASCAAGSAGPISAAAVTHADRCRPLSPEQSASRSATVSTCSPCVRFSSHTRYAGVAEGERSRASTALLPPPEA
jgi:hypothetical protein